MILADQFAKRGIVSDRVRDKALEIIDAADDIAMVEQLGMEPRDIRKRRKLLSEMRARLVAATVKPRNVLMQPQPLLMDQGDVIVYPTCGGNASTRIWPPKN